MRLARILASTPQPASRQSIAEIRAPTVRDSPHEGYLPRGTGYETAESPVVASGRSFGLGPRFAGGVSDLWLAPPHPENVLFPSGRPMRVASRTRRCNALSVHPSSNIRLQFSPIWPSRNALECRSSRGSAPLILAGALDHTH
jgi:hypothetical protein